MSFGDRRLDDALDRWLTTPPEEGWSDGDEEEELDEEDE